MIETLKCLHLLFVLGLLGTVLYSLFLFVTSKGRIPSTPTPCIWALASGALITGTLLVHPRHFTFHTPWIQAAFVLLGIFFGGMLLLQTVKNKKAVATLWIALLIILVFMTHDAVSKSMLFINI